jgi:hypothetical protein
MTTIDGRKVKTIHAYKEIFDYFNSEVPKVTDRVIINATEGGAGILGAKVMTLQEVANQYFIDKVEIPEINIYKEVDKSKILSDLYLIKKDVIEIRKFLPFFRKYIDSLIDNKVDYEIIVDEVDAFVERIREKKAEKYLDTFISWIWYLLPMSLDSSDKIGALDLLEESFSRFLGLLEKQIEALIGLGVSVDVNNQTDAKEEIK